MRWLVEDPTTLYWMLGVLAIALVTATIVTRRLVYAGGAGVVLLIAGLIWLVDYLVVTDREAVTSKCLQLAEAAERGDIETISNLLAPNCTAMIAGANLTDNSRETLVQHARTHLPRQGTREIVVWVVDITSSRDGRSHVCHCEIRFGGDFGPYQVGLFLAKADFTFLKDPDGEWRVRQMEVREWRTP